MCPTARSRRGIYNEHVKSEKLCQIGLETLKVRMSLRNEHFQNAARGPLKYVGPGPSAPHFENVHTKKRIEGGDPLQNYSFWIDFVSYGDPRPRDYHHQIRLEKLV